MILIPTKVGDFQRITHNGTTYYFTQNSLDLLSKKTEIREMDLLSFAEYAVCGDRLIKNRMFENLQKMLESTLTKPNTVDPIKEWFDRNQRFGDPFVFPEKREIWCKTSGPNWEGKDFL